MDCECIDNLEKQFIGLEYGSKKRKVTKCDIPVSFAISKEMSEMYTVTFSVMELTVDGYSKPQKETLIHSYCPFCGTKIKKS